MGKETLFFETLNNKAVKCNVCNHYCIIKNGKRGICGVRENRDGVLETLVYPKIIARSIDPVEKKPLYHVLPGSKSYSIASVGCNFKCMFCQNSDIAQMPGEKNMIRGVDIPPQNIVAEAIQGSCASISYTYTEPTVFFEYALETAEIAHKHDLLNVFVTNGYMSHRVIEKVSPFLDAANVDLKAFNKNFYKKYCKAELEPVKDNLKFMKSQGIIIEVTTLLIPGLNDDLKEIEQLALFLVDELGPETPWHISRFYPSYKMKEVRSTPVRSLETAYKIGKEAGLYNVYVGNAPQAGLEDTFCPNCRSVLVVRSGYKAESIIQGGRCPNCNTAVYGVY